MLKSLRSVLAALFCCYGSLGLSNNSDLWNVLVKFDPHWWSSPACTLSSLGLSWPTHPPSRVLWQWGQCQWTARRWELAPYTLNALHMALALDDAFLCSLVRFLHHLVLLRILWYTSPQSTYAWHILRPQTLVTSWAHYSAAGFGQLPLWVLVGFSVCFLLRERLMHLLFAVLTA